MIASFGDPRLPERFWEKCIPEPNSGCWLWLGAGSQIKIDGLQVEARRFAYRAFVGEAKSRLLPACGGDECCNPDHQRTKRPDRKNEYQREYRTRPGVRERSNAAQRAAYAKDPQKRIAATLRWMDNNKDRHLANKSRWEREQRRLNPGRHRRRHLNYRYGLTERDFAKMLEDQGGACAICRVLFQPDAEGRKNATHVDHDHATGSVRGLLCFGCNAGLGLFRESPDALIAAVAYLASARKVG